MLLSEEEGDIKLMEVAKASFRYLPYIPRTKNIETDWILNIMLDLIG